MPSPGRILQMRTPSGPGIRDDSGVTAGLDVPIFYDPMISKLIAWAEERHVPLVLATMPFHPDVGPSVFPNEWAEFHRVLDSLEASGRVRVLRVTAEELELTDEHFIDQAHLNGKGVARFTTWLRDRLERVEAAGR